MGNSYYCNNPKIFFTQRNVSHSYVVIELKATKFKPEYIGQLLFYTNYIDSYVKSDLDSPTIGIVLCSEANSIICKTTLKNTKNLAVSKYKILKELPDYLSNKLKEIKKGQTN